MLPDIGLIIATYAIARLAQAPLVIYENGSVRWIAALVISILASAGIVMLVFSLLMTSASVHVPGIQ